MFWLARKATGNTKRAADISNNGAGVFIGFWLWFSFYGGDGRGVLFCGRGHSLWRTSDGGSLARVANQNTSNQNNVPSISTQFTNDTIPRTWNFNKRLVGFHLGHCLMFFDGVANLHAPLNKFGFVNTFTKIWKNEMTFVVRLFYASHVRFSKSEWIWCEVCRAKISKRQFPLSRGQCDPRLACNPVQVCSRA